MARCWPSFGVFLFICGATAIAAAGSASARPGRTIIGTSDNDVLTGTPGADTIKGLAGNDDITGGKGDDRIDAGEGDDIIRWASGDEHDLIFGGPDLGDFGDSLVIDTKGRALRLHIQALPGAAAPQARPNAPGTQVIGVDGIEHIEVPGSLADDRLVISMDQGVVGPGGSLNVEFGTFNIGGNDFIDASGAQVRTLMSASSMRGGGAVVIGSAKFYDDISTAAGNDRIWTGDGGSSVGAGSGVNEIHLGAGVDEIVEFHEFEPRTHDTVFGFGKGDFVTLFDADSSQLDTNGDGWVDARDRHVTVTKQGMTIDLTPILLHDNKQILLTLVGRTRLRLGRFHFECGC